MTKYEIQEKIRSQLLTINSTIPVGLCNFEIDSQLQIIAKMSFRLRDEYYGEIELNKRQLRNLLTNEEFKELIKIILNEIEGY